MSENREHLRNYARIALASIRLLNGILAFFTPTLLAKRFGDTPHSSVNYALRLFGVRTIVIGIELLLPDEAARASALRYAIPIHASDTVAAALAGMQGQLPRRTAMMLTALSGLNTTLAILAQPRNNGM